MNDRLHDRKVGAMGVGDKSDCEDLAVLGALATIVQEPPRFLQQRRGRDQVPVYVGIVPIVGRKVGE